MTQAFNLSQLANKVNSSGQLDAATGLYNSDSLGFPSGTRMSFNQTSAPTGWTKDTSSTINDSILRLVTGTVSSGGSTAFSTWNSSGTTSSTTLSTSQIPSHDHIERYFAGASGIQDAVTTSYNGGGSQPTITGATNYGVGYGNTTGNLTTASTGGGGSHSHALSNNIKYYDFIIATKN